MLADGSLAEDARFRSFTDRKADEDALEAVISELTRTRDKWELAAALQECGVAASAVEKLPELIEQDPQLAGYYQRISQPTDPSHEITVDSNPIRFAGRERSVKRAPMLGEHNEAVLSELLGMTPDAYAQLVLDDVLK